jgi:hypothetical protein
VGELLAEIAQQVPQRVQCNIVLVFLDKRRHSEGSKYLVGYIFRLHLGMGTVEKVRELDGVICLFVIGVNKRNKQRNCSSSSVL